MISLSRCPDQAGASRNADEVIQTGCVCSAPKAFVVRRFDNFTEFGSASSLGGSSGNEMLLRVTWGVCVFLFDGQSNICYLR